MKTQYKTDFAGNRVPALCQPVRYPRGQAKGILWICHGCDTIIEANRPPLMRKCSIHGFCLFDPANSQAGRRFRGEPGAMKEYG